MKKNKNSDQVLFAAFTLLVKLDILNLKDVKYAIRAGHDGLFDLIDKKYKDLVKEGKITHNKVK